MVKEPTIHRTQQEHQQSRDRWVLHWRHHVGSVHPDDKHCPASSVMSTGMRTVGAVFATGGCRWVTKHSAGLWADSRAAAEDGVHMAGESWLWSMSQMLGLPQCPVCSPANCCGCRRCLVLQETSRVKENSLVWNLWLISKTQRSGLWREEARKGEKQQRESRKVGERPLEAETSGSYKKKI